MDGGGHGLMGLRFKKNEVGNTYNQAAMNFKRWTRIRT